MKTSLLKIFLCCILIFILIIPFFNYDDHEIKQENISYEIKSAQIYDISRNENDVLKSMQKAVENENLALYFKPDEDLLALVNKRNNFIWWSSPVNSGCDESTTLSLKYEMKSSLIVSYHNEKESISHNLKSAENAEIAYSIYDNLLIINYDFKSEGIKIPVQYSLGTDYLEVNILSESIAETMNKHIHEITVMNSFGAGNNNESGYFIIPDGSGAVIKFNNEKKDAESYSKIVYGEDISSVPEKISSYTQQVSLPLYSVVKENENALLAVVSDGDENMKLNSSVSIQNKTQYNKCFFTFIMRSSDNYYIGNEENPVTVYEENSISNDIISMRYFILNKNDISYCDIAERYRDYLIDEMNLKPKGCTESSDIHINFYGGTMKKKSFFGIPVYTPVSFTSFSQAESMLKETGINNLTVSFRNFTDNSIENMAEYSSYPSDTLNGRQAFNSLYEYVKNNNGNLYPVTENITFKSGNGFSRFSDASVRISGEYSEIFHYDYAYGVKDKFRESLYLISPDSLSEIYQKISENYEYQNISLGKALSVLYGDYAGKEISRGDMKDIILNSLENMNFNILAEYPNAYALPYVDFIAYVPIVSSQYDIFDCDIPFFQMVIHGVIPYSSTPVNSSPNPESDMLKSVAYGSALSYDLIYSDVHNFKDTEADKYFYSGYSDINNDYEKTKDIISAVKDCFITDYTITDTGFIIEYSNGIRITFDDISDSINLFQT